MGKTGEKRDLIHYVYYLRYRGKVAYVGRSVDPEKRWRHFCRKHERKFKLSFNGPFTFDVASALELSEIRRCRPPLNCYLASSPGMLGKTYEVTAEMITKRVAARSGYTPSKETRRKIAAKHEGTVWTEERRKAFGLIRTGGKHTEATKKKMRKSAIRIWHERKHAI